MKKKFSPPNPVGGYGVWEIFEKMFFSFAENLYMLVDRGSNADLN